MDLATLLVYAFVAFTVLVGVYVTVGVLAELFYLIDYVRQARRRVRKGGE